MFRFLFLILDSFSRWYGFRNPYRFSYKSFQCFLPPFKWKSNLCSCFSSVRWQESTRAMKLSPKVQEQVEIQQRHFARTFVEQSSSWALGPLQYGGSLIGFNDWCMNRFSNPLSESTSPLTYGNTFLTVFIKETFFSLLTYKNHINWTKVKMLLSGF